MLFERRLAKVCAKDRADRDHKHHDWDHVILQQRRNGIGVVLPLRLNIARKVGILKDEHDKLRADGPLTENAVGAQHVLPALILARLEHKVGDQAAAHAGRDGIRAIAHQKCD